MCEWHEWENGQIQARENEKMQYFYWSRYLCNPRRTNPNLFMEEEWEGTKAKGQHVTHRTLRRKRGNHSNGTASASWRQTGEVQADQTSSRPDVSVGQLACVSVVVASHRSAAAPWQATWCLTPFDTFDTCNTWAQSATVDWGEHSLLWDSGDCRLHLYT